jgi:nicotinamidase-related amidase
MSLASYKAGSSWRTTQRQFITPSNRKQTAMLQLDPRSTALVLIDLQKGLLALPLAPHAAPQIVATSCRLATAIAAAGGLVVLVRVDFGAGLAATPKGATDVPLAIPPGRMPADWAEIFPELIAAAPHIVVTKRSWSAFYGTSLDLELRRRGITHIVVGGIATNFGVESTARDGWQGNYTVIVAEDAASSFRDEMHEFAIKNTLPRCSLVRKSDEIIAALSKARAA